jgi:hypothetical protein
MRICAIDVDLIGLAVTKLYFFVIANTICCPAVVLMHWTGNQGTALIKDGVQLCALRDGVDLNGPVYYGVCGSTAERAS